MTRLLFAILFAALFAGAVGAVQQNPLRDRLLRNDRSAETTGWYQRADTGEFFLFDRSGEAALLRERDAPDAEVLVLYPNRAPGGGTAYITDMGREVIRITGLGGATYFPMDAPDGVIVEFASPSGALTPAPRSPSEVRGRAEQLVSSLARSLDRNLQVEYSPAPRAGLGVQYDTLGMIEMAFERVHGERRYFRDVENINIVLGTQPSAYREGDALVVVIAPELGYAGRPSSVFIAEALIGNL
ncbi:DUF4908 domain-containing protein [Maricaulis parjimensis]|uniref:DUF4908 domain-containing protein n=1 Tax=Maricaulis parjimensis TaxID=144023 RepID=UPI00193A832F|nr:DUF4908 domain-containing protein [Maricaulis parjimensis]